MVHIVEKQNMRIAFSEDGRVLMQIPPEYRIIKMPDIEQVYSYTIKKEYANKDPKTQKIYLKITPDSLKLMTLVNNIPEAVVATVFRNLFEFPKLIKTHITASTTYTKHHQKTRS